MIIVGLTHPISWNGAACILVDGKLVAMVEEERLNRVKHAPRMPAKLAMEYCLKEAGVTLDKVDYVAVGFDSAMQAAWSSLRGDDTLLSSLNQAASWLRDGMIYERKLPLDGVNREKVIFVNHHLSHAASTFYASGFLSANILSLDGSGGSESGILGVGEERSIKVLKTVPNRGSWGLMYESITDKLGFRRHSGEGKVMGLAAYGTPDPKGLPFVNWDNEIPVIDIVKRKAFINSLPQRAREEPITQFHKDLAATMQDTLERAGARMSQWLFEQTGIRRLCLAGGTALNCSMNGKLAQLPWVDEIFIQPAAYDAGTALGAALQVYTEKMGQRPAWRMDHAYWGPEYTNDEIQTALNAFTDITYERVNDIFTDAATQLAAGKIVGWFQGRSEVGPRALGNRSILANPSRTEMKDRVNMQVKHREPWRPFAPSILEEEVEKYTGLQIKSPFMILAFDTQEDKRKEIISATHVDGTCRPQSVSKATNPRYWQLIKRFSELTGIPALLNTSFNVDSQPIVNNPQEAIDTFLNCGMEVLAIGDFIVYKRK